MQARNTTDALVRKCHPLPDLAPLRLTRLRRRPRTGGIFTPMSVAYAPAAQLVFEETTLSALFHAFGQLGAPGGSRCTDLGGRAAVCRFRVSRFGPCHERG
jgi:hypothetical protein